MKKNLVAEMIANAEMIVNANKANIATANKTNKLNKSP